MCQLDLLINDQHNSIYSFQCILYRLRINHARMGYSVGHRWLGFTVLNTFHFYCLRLVASSSQVAQTKLRNNL